jgi:ABC-type uncharacterized transport system permease subunit
MKQRRFEQNTSFHSNEIGDKEFNFQIGPQFLIYSIKSSIAILILGINSIASVANRMLALKLAVFFISVIGLEFMHFNPQLINKLLFFSI